MSQLVNLVDHKSTRVIDPIDTPTWRNRIEHLTQVRFDVLRGAHITSDACEQRAQATRILVDVVTRSCLESNAWTRLPHVERRAWITWFDRLTRYALAWFLVATSDFERVVYTEKVRHLLHSVAHLVFTHVSHTELALLAREWMLDPNLAPHVHEPSEPLGAPRRRSGVHMLIRSVRESVVHLRDREFGAKDRLLTGETLLSLKHGLTENEYPHALSRPASNTSLSDLDVGQPPLTLLSTPSTCWCNALPDRPTSSTPTTRASAPSNCDDDTSTALKPPSPSTPRYRTRCSSSNMKSTKRPRSADAARGSPASCDDDALPTAPSI